MAFLPPPLLLNQQAKTANNVTSRFPRTRACVNPSSDDNPPQPKNGAARLQQVGRILGTAGAAAAATVAAFTTLGNTGAPELGDNSPSAPIGVLAARAGGFTTLSVSEKLSQVPVFAVTNASGQPYLANTDGSGSQVGYIFLSHVDALAMLKDMKKNPGGADARVYIMGLDKAYEMVKAKPTPSGIRGGSGEELTMVFRFFPDSKQVKHAKRFSRRQVDGVPVFVAKGLTLKKGNDTIVPLFLTKEDVDTAWAKLHNANKNVPKHADVEVGNLLYIVQQMEKGDNPDVKRLGFFAPSASVEYVATEQAAPKNQARMHQNPVAATANK